jgi:catechol 2,3-dioxygenase-like lactoylglutathione lyase family enzyme
VGRAGRALGAALLLILAAAITPAAASPAIVAGLKFGGGFQELVISVPDLEEAITFYQQIAGWRVLQRGATQPETLSSWGLPDNAKAIEAVLQSPGSRNGFVRLIKFRGVPQEEARPSAQPWETGGLTGFTVTAANVQSEYLQFRRGGWHGFSQPAQVRHGGNTITEVMMQGFGSEVIKITQPLKPTKDKNLSPALAAFAAVTDLDVTLAFYTEKLGFSIFQREDGLAGDVGRNALGLPHNIINNVYRRTAYVHPKGSDPNDAHLGALVFTTYYGVRGDDFSSRARAPNFGIIGVRFAVDDADALMDQYKARGVVPAYDVTDIGMSPYGAVKAFGVRDPNGILLEFFEPRDKPNS